MNGLKIEKSFQRLVETRQVENDGGRKVMDIFTTEYLTENKKTLVQKHEIFATQQEYDAWVKASGDDVKVNGVQVVSNGNICVNYLRVV
jgi:polyribonucleotide nucleotidyltransferase